MRIIHAGGYPAIVSLYVRGLTSLGLDARVFTMRSQGDDSPLRTLLEEDSTTLLHLHLTQSDRGLAQLLKGWPLDARKRTILHLWDEAFPLRSLLPHPAPVVTGLLGANELSFPILSTPLLKDAPSPLPLESPWRVLFVPVSEKESLTRLLFEEAKKALEVRPDIHFVFAPPLERLSPQALHKLLSLCHIVVDSPFDEGYGPLAVFGMSARRPVLSVECDERETRWRPLKVCPVLRYSRDSLKDVILRVVREPKSLFDLGNRGLAYVNQYHKGQTTLHALLSLYKNINGPSIPEVHSVLKAPQ